ncbi:hypothetical protein ACWD8I_34210, partial [Micromonospora arida]
MSRTIRRKHLLAGLATAGVLGVGIAAPTIAFAADTPTPTPSTSTAPAPGTAPGAKADRQGEFAEALAKELGVPTDKVTAALEKVREQHRPADRPQRPSTEDRQQAPDGERQTSGDRSGATGAFPGSRAPCGR